MLAALALPLLAASAYAATTCNGDASLCTRKYSNVTFIGTHNSYSVGNAVTNNQLTDVTTQLNNGVRALQVQAHWNDNQVYLCHSTCLLQNGGTFEAYLTKVKSWMDANPNDVVSLVIVNSDNRPASDFGAVYASVGLDKMAFSPSAATLAVADWPTLGSMIDASTRLVTFMDNTADTTSVPYIMDEFTNMWEDAYDVTDQSFPCTVNRTKGNENSQLYMINHFLDNTMGLFGVAIFTPNTAKLNETNAASGTGSVGFHADNCLAQWGRAPNIILLDYYDAMGNAPFLVAASLNSLSASTVKDVTANMPGTQSSNSSTTGSASTTGVNADVSTAPIKSAADSLRAAAGALVAAAAFALLA